MKKIGIGVALMGLLIMMLVLRQPVEEEEERELQPSSAVTVSDAQSKKEDFSFDRQQVAKLALSKAAEKPVSVERVRRKPQLRTTRAPEGSFMKLLRQAERERDGAPVYQMIFDRMAESPAKDTLASIEALMSKGEGTRAQRYLNMNAADKEALLLLLASPEIVEIVDLMHVAASKQTCDFQLDYSEGFSLALPHLGPMRSLARLGGLETLARTDWDDPEAALSIAEAGLRVGRDAGSDNLLISGLVGISADRIMLESLVGLSQHPELPKERAYSVLVEMAKRDYVQDMGKAIEFEATMANQLIASLAEDPNLMDQLGDEAPAELKTLLSDPAFVERSQASMRAIAEQYAALTRLPVPEAREAIEALNKELQGMQKGPDSYFARMLMPSYGKVIRKSQDAIAELDAVYVDVLTAVYRGDHGRDPQSPEDLEYIIEEANRY